MKIKTFIFILCCFTFVNIQISYGKILVKNGDFSISLPDGWVEIPRDILDFQTMQHLIHEPGFSTLRYNYAFQLKSDSDAWFKHPFLLVEIKHSGRIKEKEVYDSLKEISLSVDKIEQDFSPTILESCLKKIYYDRKLHIVWRQEESTSRKTGKLSNLYGIILTQKGWIRISATCLEKDYVIYEPVFKSIVESVVLHPDLVYRRQWKEGLQLFVNSLDWKQVLMFLAIGGVIGWHILISTVTSIKTGKKEDINQ
ncbi:hypothetical protein M0P98_09000 [bacterium]|nr:hypothetical protein [bacterium]